MNKSLLSFCFFTLIMGLMVIESQGAPTAAVGEQLSYSDVVAEINETAIIEHVEKFASFGSRVTGYPGSEEAAEYIRDEFSRIGLVDVAYEYFDVAVPIDHGANITVHTEAGTTRVIEAYPLWPNLVQTSPTPPGGITAKLLYVGKGLSELEGKNVEGKMVLMDLDSGYEWKRVFAMGAKAIVFIEPEEVTREEFELKVANIPLYAPRLYVSRDDGEYLKNISGSDAEATITSLMRYENVKARNVIGYIPGVDIQDEVTAISAYYDSFSFVPSLSPGAQESLGVSTLLELAKFFKKHPPLRTLEFIAFAGHHQSVAGATDWTERQFNNTISVDGAILFRVHMIFSLDYSTEVKTLGIFPHDSFYPVGGSMYYQPNPPRNQAFHATIFDVILPRMRDELGYDPKLVLPVADDPTYLRYSFEPIPRVVDSSALEVAGGIGFGIRTTNCLRSYQYVPSDTPDRVVPSNLRPQLEFTYACMYEAANMQDYVMHETTPERQHLTQWGFGAIEGQAVTYNYSSGWYDPLPNALIYMRTDPPSAQPERALFTDVYYWIGVADDEGKFTIHGVRPTTGFMMWYTIEVYKIDWATGTITHAPDLGQYGDKTFSQRFYFERGWLGTKVHPRYFVAFPCSTIALHTIVDPTTFDVSQIHVEPNNFFSHGPFLSWGTTGLGVQRAAASIVTLPFSLGITEALAFIPEDSAAEILIRAGYYPYPVAVFTNASREHPQGVGYRLQLGQYFDIFWTPREAANSMLHLTEDRLLGFTSLNVYSPIALDYYEGVLSSFSAMEDDLSNERYNDLYWQSYSAWAYVINTYFATMNLTLETVYSCIFFYMLLLPFVFLAERLLFPQRGKRRLLAMITLFAVCTMFLYLFHPGFRIASSIFMATLGFTIIALASPLIIIMVGKLIGVVKVLRKRMLGAHFAEISRTGALLLSFSFGIENMRRRKLRSALTLSTVTIITFSLITFTSGTPIAITKGLTWENVETPYSGLLVRAFPWKPLTDELVTYLREEYRETATLAPRFWAYGPQEEIPVTNLDSGNSAKAATFLGVSEAESEITGMDEMLLEGLFFEQFKEEAKVCIISQYLAEKLEAHTGDTLSIFGMNLLIVGIMDGTGLYSITELDQEAITPRDILSPLPPGMQLVAQAGKDVPHVPGDLVILIPYKLARLTFWKTSQNAGTYSVAVKFHDQNITMSVAEEFSKRSRTILFASEGDGTVGLYIPRKTWGVTGLEILAVPLIIGIFIILNTMLGGISERVREIGVFGSLGLSPVHVAGMFLAESIVYGVLAGVIGYILGIATINILYPLALVPENLYPNFSSFMVVLAVVLALAATVASTAYPLLKASRLVTPTIERRWKPPTKPEGLEWNIPLPFVMTEGETSGLLAFLREYFLTHNVERAGMFMATNVETRIGEEGDRILAAEVRLEPFEVGIIQTVELVAMPSEEAGRNTFNLYIRREAGVSHTWRTSNIDFATEIRRQFLLWSSLRSSERSRYLTEGIEIWQKS